MPKLSERFDEPVALLFESDEALPQDARAAIVDAGSDVIDDLVDVLEDRGLWDEEAPGQGWAPIHAAEILGEIGDEQALPALFRVLRIVDPDAVLDDAVEDAIVSFGEAAIKPGRAELKSWNDVFLIDLAHVFARLEVQNKSVFQVLLKFFIKDPEHGAPLLAEYGDPAGRDAIDVVLQRYVVAASDDPDQAKTIVALGDAYEDLGGKLTGDAKKTVKTIRKKKQRVEDIIERAKSGDDPSIGEDTYVRERDLGRNEPCWCGSGQKYKRCHWAEDNR
ncbi:MAG: SEC-C domain-containing protein [Myxococcota bacterium]